LINELKTTALYIKFQQKISTAHILGPAILINITKDCCRGKNRDYCKSYNY